MMASIESTMRVVFTVFFGFWGLVLVLLFLGTGLLLKIHQRKDGSGSH